MATLKDFVTQESRPLPVILLADTSGSMTANGKIQILNDSVRDMLSSFQKTEDLRSVIYFLSITFGDGHASLHTSFRPVNEVNWQPMPASGDTPMGKAFSLLTEILESKDEIPSRSYRPAIILVSDGQPNDSWEQPLQALLNSPRAGKAFRFAMGIGEDADLGMLNRFLSGSDQRVFSASDSRDIQKFFRYVTMSVTTRSRSQNPNVMLTLPPMADDLDDLEF